MRLVQRRGQRQTCADVQVAHGPLPRGPADPRAPDEDLPDREGPRHRRVVELRGQQAHPALQASGERGVEVATERHRSRPGVPQVHRMLPVPERVPRAAQPRAQAPVRRTALPGADRRARDAPDRRRGPRAVPQGRRRDRPLQHHQVLHRGLPREHPHHRQCHHPAQGAGRGSLLRSGGDVVAGDHRQEVTSASGGPVARRLFPTVLRAIAAITLSTSVAHAQRADLSFPVVNGDVTAMAISGQTLYLGGDFTSIGAYTGGGVPIDSVTAAALPGFPRINGAVTAVISDERGGWFVAGAFDSVGGLPRRGLAHIRFDLSVSPWNPGTDGYVGALVLSNDVVYIGGQFSTVGGQPREGLAAVTAFGNVASWGPSVSTYGTVHALAASGNTIFVGGDFEGIGLQTRHSLAAVDASTDAVLPWNPDVFSCGIFGGCSRGAVYSLTVSGNLVYAGGNFPRVGGGDRGNVAAIDVSTGAATGWNPGASGNVYAIAVRGGTVYLGGLFYAVGGGAGALSTRTGLAAVDSVTGVPTAWDPEVQGIVGPYGGRVRSLALEGGTVYIGGEFTGVGSDRRANLAAVDVVTGAATSWTPSGFAPVACLTADDGAVFAGAVSTNVGGLERHNLAALDLATGQPTAWNPDADAPVRT